MATLPRRVTVVGAGVIGLSCAWRLVGAGHRVTVVTDRAPAQTTSAVAAALWYPYLAFPPERVGAWAARTYAVLSDLASAGRDGDTAVRLLRGRELLAAPTPDPPWAVAVPDLRRLHAFELAGHPDGWGFTAPVVDMPRYLEWLLRRVLAAGVRLEHREVAHLSEEAGRCDVLVNCAGLAARELAGDPSLLAVRGQVVLLENPGLREWVLDETDPTAMTYVVPRVDTVVCGGTAEPGAEGLEPDPVVAARILANARALIPQLEGAAVVGHRVGLRPARPTVRLERVPGRDGAVIHCYGHGGAGVTLSWGCAQDVLALVESLR